MLKENMGYEDNYNAIKNHILRHPNANVTLEILYDLIDKVLYANVKTPPQRNKSYYEKHGPIIKRMERDGTLIPAQYAQAWKVARTEINEIKLLKDKPEEVK